MKRDIDNRVRALESAKGSYIVGKLGELWSTNVLKYDRRFHPPSENFAFCFVARRCMTNGTQLNFAKREEVNGADSSRIRWRRIVNVNETIEIRLLVSRAPKHFKLAMASRRLAFSGNASLMATLYIVDMYFFFNFWISECPKLQLRKFKFVRCCCSDPLQ